MISPRHISLLVLAASLAGCSSTGSSGAGKAPGADDITVVSYNIRNGGRRLDGVYDRPLQRRILAGLKPDLVALEEVDHFTKRAGDTADVTREFAGDLGMSSLYAGALPYGGGFYGIASLSRFPVVADETLPLPVPGSEPRAAALRFVDLPGGARIAFLAVHLDSERASERRIENVKTLLTRLNRITEPVVITGDFNDIPDSECLSLFEKAGFRRCVPEGDARSFPADHPKVAIDHLLIRDGDRFAVTDLGTHIVDEPGSSDHRPLRGRLHIAPK